MTHIQRDITCTDNEAGVYVVILDERAKFPKIGEDVMFAEFSSCGCHSVTDYPIYKKVEFTGFPTEDKCEVRNLND